MNSKNQTSPVSSEIATLAHEIGGEGFNTFSDNDLDEMIQDVAMSDGDILRCIILGPVEDPKECEVEDEPVPLTANLIREGLQLCSKLENHFLVNDADNERALKFQRELKTCMSDYRELYKGLVKQPPQRLITDYIVKEKKSILNEHEVTVSLESSSDESDLEPIHKKIRVLSDSDE